MKRESIVAPFIVRLRGADKLLRGMVLGDVIILNSATPAHLHESLAQNNASRIKWGLLPANECRFIHALSDIGFLPYNKEYSCHLLYIAAIAAQEGYADSRGAAWKGTLLVGKAERKDMLRIMECKESYMEALLAAQSAWESYRDPKSLAPVMALVRLSGHPALDDYKVTAEQLFGLLSRVYAKALILKPRSNASPMCFAPYLSPLFREYNLTVDYRNKQSVLRWLRRLCTDWPSEPSLPVYRKAADTIFENTVDRWYSIKSCDDFKEVALTILDDAIRLTENHPEEKSIEPKSVRAVKQPRQCTTHMPLYAAGP